VAQEHPLQGCKVSKPRYMARHCRRRCAKCCDFQTRTHLPSEVRVIAASASSETPDPAPSLPICSTYSDKQVGVLLSRFVTVRHCGSSGRQFASPGHCLAWYSRDGAQVCLDGHTWAADPVAATAKTIAPYLIILTTPSTAQHDNSWAGLPRPEGYDVASRRSMSRFTDAVVATQQSVPNDSL
jgi:hypothetical protein